jgi:hypothetical protein
VPDEWAWVRERERRLSVGCTRSRVIGSGLVDQVSRVWHIKKIRIDSDFWFYSFPMAQKGKIGKNI